ncbi:MAG: PAS domain-containing protein [Pseudomonadota bacterium]
MRHNKTKKVLGYWMELLDQAAPIASVKIEDGPTPASSPVAVPTLTRRWPDRADIQPAACRELLPDMFILDSEGSQPVYRLAGTALCALYGREMRRETFDLAFEGWDRRAVHNWIARMGVDDYLILICSRAETDGGDAVTLETLLMPLEHNGQNDQRILGLTVPCSTPHWLGITPITSQSVRSIRVIRPWESDAFRANWPFEVPDGLRDGGRRRLDGRSLDTVSLNKYQGTPTIAPNLDDARQIAHLKVIDGGRSA